MPLLFLLPQPFAVPPVATRTELSFHFKFILWFLKKILYSAGRLGHTGSKRLSDSGNVDMDKKAILWPVIISVVIHMTLLAVAGMIDLNDKIKPVNVLSVNIQEPAPAQPSPEKENPAQGNPSSSVTKQQNDPTPDDAWREDTINLGSLDTKYIHYLTRVKNKILRIWKYPQTSFERNEEGNVVVRMSIDADGRLAAVTLVSSSGSADLDNGALGVVQEAAPYEPLPGSYNLSRLHIVASFNYKIMD
jgi:TonB family protein